MNLYKSETTGQPKGAELRHRYMRDNALMSVALFNADSEHPYTYLCVLPLFHSFRTNGDPEWSASVRRNDRDATKI